MTTATTTAAREYEAIVRALGGTVSTDDAPLDRAWMIIDTGRPDHDDARALDIAFPKPHTLTPRRVALPGQSMRRESVERCEFCRGTGVFTAEGIYTGPYEDGDQCRECHGTGRTPAVDPDDPLAVLSPSVAHEAVRIASWMALPVWESWARIGNNRDWCRAALDGVASSDPVDMPTWNSEPLGLPLAWTVELSARVHGVPVDVACVAHAIGAWWRTETVGRHRRNQGGDLDWRGDRFAFSLLRHAGLDLAHWWAVVRARLAFRDVDSTEVTR